MTLHSGKRRDQENQDPFVGPKAKPTKKRLVLHLPPKFSNEPTTPLYAPLRSAVMHYSSRHLDRGRSASSARYIPNSRTRQAIEDEEGSQNKRHTDSNESFVETITLSSDEIEKEDQALQIEDDISQKDQVIEEAGQLEDLLEQEGNNVEQQKVDILEPLSVEKDAVSTAEPVLETNKQNASIIEDVDTPLETIQHDETTPVEEEGTPSQEESKWGSTTFKEGDSNAVDVSEVANNEISDSHDYEASRIEDTIAAAAALDKQQQQEQQVEESSKQEENAISKTDSIDSEDDITVKTPKRKAENEPVATSQALDLESLVKEYERSSQSSITSEVKLEISTLLKAFPGLSVKYKIFDKIGEGTFSTVYKAIDIQNLSETNSGKTKWCSPPIKNQQQNKKNNKMINGNFSSSALSSTLSSVSIVALKRIYVTSSPQRIYNELQLLHSLVGCPNVAPLIDAVRYEDQVIAVLPFHKHADFRDFYRDLPLCGIKIYMYELFTALSFVHEKFIIHRDIKPTNFLYNPFTRRGVLVDFGLAERELEPDHQSCPCFQGGLTQDEIAPINAIPAKGYLKDDQRSGRRANRAGTRGFRAPEVLLKCPNQTVLVDIWSAGVMLLTLLSRRFPFFNSSDDVDALIEITTIFGIPEMKKVSQLHGLGMDSSLPKLETSKSLGGLIYSSIALEAKEGDTLAEDSPAWEVLYALDKKGRPDMNSKLGQDYKDALELLEQCLKLNHHERISADDALKLKFFDSLRKKRNDGFMDDIILD